MIEIETEDKSKDDSQAGASGSELSFSLTEFIHDWSDLFVVMSVFAGLAIYIKKISSGDLQNSSNVLKGGYVAALLLSLFIGILIFYQIKEVFGTWIEFVHGLYYFKNFNLLIFLVVLSMLFRAIVSSILTFTEISYYIVMTLSGLLSLVAYWGLFTIIDERFLRNRNENWLLATMFGVNFLIAYSSFSAFQWIESNLVVIQANNFNLTKAVDMLPALTRSGFLILFLLSAPMTVIFLVFSLARASSYLLSKTTNQISKKTS